MVISIKVSDRDSAGDPIGKPTEFLELEIPGLEKLVAAKIRLLELEIKDRERQAEVIERIHKAKADAGMTCNERIAESGGGSVADSTPSPPPPPANKPKRRGP